MNYETNYEFKKIIHLIHCGDLIITIIGVSFIVNLCCAAQVGYPLQMPLHLQEGETWEGKLLRVRSFEIEEVSGTQFSFGGAVEYFDILSNRVRIDILGSEHWRYTVVMFVLLEPMKTGFQSAFIWGGHGNVVYPEALQVLQR